MPKYWVKNYFAHGRFPEVGQKQKTEKKKKKEGERKLVITMAKLRMAHASTHGARKPPGPKMSQLPFIICISIKITSREHPWVAYHQEKTDLGGGEKTNI